MSLISSPVTTTTATTTIDHFWFFSSLVRRKVFLVDSKIDLNHERMEI